MQHCGRKNGVECVQNQTQYYDTVPLEYKKLSGWMIFFIVTQVWGMFSNLGTLPLYIRSDASLWVFSTLLVTVLQVLMLIFLGTRRREFCYFYYAIGAVNIFLYFRMFFLPGADVPLTFVQLISWALVFTAWCVYFSKSARLKYYFIWNDNENQQFLAAYEQKVLFLLDAVSGAHAASSFAYMPAQHVQAVILYPAAAYVCGLPESANLMNAYPLVLERIPVFLGHSETIYSNALRQYDLYHAAFLRREMEPPLDAIAFEVVRALDPSRVSVPEISAMLASIHTAYQAAFAMTPASMTPAASYTPYPAAAQQPAAQPIAQPAPAPTPQPVSSPEAAPPSTAQPSPQPPATRYCQFCGAPYGDAQARFCTRCGARLPS